MTKIRLQSVLSWLAPIVAFALLGGWSVHRDSPEGLLIYTAGQACPTVSHGFTKVYGGILAVSAGLALALAAAYCVVAEMGLMAKSREPLRRAALSCVVFALGIGVMALLIFPIEHFFPLSPRASCLAPAPLR